MPVVFLVALNEALQCIVWHRSVIPLYNFINKYIYTNMGFAVNKGMYLQRSFTQQRQKIHDKVCLDV